MYYFISSKQDISLKYYLAYGVVAFVGIALSPFELASCKDAPVMFALLLGGIGGFGLWCAGLSLVFTLKNKNRNNNLAYLTAEQIQSRAHIQNQLRQTQLTSKALSCQTENSKYNKQQAIAVGTTDTIGPMVAGTDTAETECAATPLPPIEYDRTALYAMTFPNLPQPDPQSEPSATSVSPAQTPSHAQRARQRKKASVTEPLKIS